MSEYFKMPELCTPYGNGMDRGWSRMEISPVRLNDHGCKGAPIPYGERPNIAIAQMECLNLIHREGTIL